MTKETRQFSVVAYRDNDGNPCCAIDFRKGDVCLFYQTQRFGVNETCAFADRSGRYAKTLERRDGGNGSLVPCAECPVWGNVKDEPLGSNTETK